MDMNVKPLKIKKYSRDESKKLLQQYAIDIASGVGSELKDIDVLEYITCLSEDDRRMFKNLEKKIRNHVITSFTDDMYNDDLVHYTVRDCLKSLLDAMDSGDIVKIASAFEGVDAEYIADAIMFCMKKKLEK